MMNASLRPNRSMTSAAAPGDWQGLDGLLTEILAHRGFVRASGPSEPTGLDRIAGDLGRIHAMLGVVGSRCGSADVRFEAAVAQTYRWALEIGTLLADLEVASLDRAVSAPEAEAFARRAVTAYVVALEPCFDAAQATTAGSEEAALRWDLETLRAAVERALVATFDLP